MKVKSGILLIFLFLHLMACKHGDSEVVVLNEKDRYMSYLFEFLNAPFDEVVEKIKELDIQNNPQHGTLEDEELEEELVEPGVELHWFEVIDKMNSKNVTFELYTVNDTVNVCVFSFKGEDLVGSIKDILWSWASFFRHYSPSHENMNYYETWWHDFTYVCQYDTGYFIHESFDVTQYKDTIISDTIVNWYKFQERLNKRIKNVYPFDAVISASKDDYCGRFLFDYGFNATNDSSGWLISVILKTKFSNVPYF